MSEQPKRRWLQISLREVLWATLAIGAICAWQIERQRRIAAEDFVSEIPGAIEAINAAAAKIPHSGAHRSFLVGDARVSWSVTRDLPETAVHDDEQ